MFKNFHFYATFQVMKPGKVFNAATLASEDITMRGQGQCFNLIKSNTYAEPMTATEIHLTGNASPKGSKDCDTLIYVRSGSASLEIIGSDDENSVKVEAGSAVHIRSGENFFWANGNDLKALEVSIPVTGPFARKQSSPTDVFQRHVKQGASNKGTATGSREFEVLFDASKGSAAATMFIGFIPPSGAPDHYHLYDEICQIVSGTGSVSVDGESQDISTGSTFSITPRLLHSIVNSGTEDLWLLGIFRPQGSPAAAYYPDGRPAPGYVESE
jgi:mannose-6-phosphate isomerase-like protein (cupin superfamily)